ncbi:vWA domain-containing protein [Croceibacterium mercuriale]|uniref:vWA domain-containing protein n=1 Tax=Croceibacterium mercuriale TaxID=1572751 RepID=UPI000689E37C|nr:von Willebrand factor type A domain-containing protein [Croceibacterium mercuriale]
MRIAPAPSIVSSSAIPPVNVAADRERYAGEKVAQVVAVAEQPVSTFSVDVDTGSYANVRRMLGEGRLPPSAAVRTEEMLNYFRYDYPRPSSQAEPFTITTDMAVTPWNDATRILRIGLAGYDLPQDERPPANLVFLVDTSGSMLSMNKLPLVKCALALTAERLGPEDRVAIVAYSGFTRVVLPSTGDKESVLMAIEGLSARGSTAGGAALALAYDEARRAFREGGVNRILLATDGDFNVGVVDGEALVDTVAREREGGISLTALGFGTGNLNEAMMEQIADHGNGNYFYIDSPAEAAKVLDDELASTLFTIAKDVKIQVEFNPAHVAEYRLLGYENRALAEQDFANDAVDAGEIGAGHQVTALYEIVPAGVQGWIPERRYAANRPAAAEGSRSGEMAVVRLRYKLPDGDESLLLERALPARTVRRATAPTGDLALAIAVAGYGQTLRGDPYLRGWTLASSADLAEPMARDDLRRQFVTLARQAAQLVPTAP